MNTGIKHLIEHIICFNPAILDNRKVKPKVDKDIVKSMLLNMEHAWFITNARSNKVIIRSS